MLGGEIISKLHETPRLRKQPMADVVLAALDDEGGPLLSHRASQEEQRSFDSTCRKLCASLRTPRASRLRVAQDEVPTLCIHLFDRDHPSVLTCARAWPSRAVAVKDGALQRYRREHGGMLAVQRDK
jgi:hypothetical protein